MNDAIKAGVVNRDSVQLATAIGGSSNGNAVTEVHADGGIVSSGYDLFGQRISVKQPDFTVSPGVVLYGTLTSYAYDHLGHLLSIGTGSSNAGIAVQVYAYKSPNADNPVAVAQAQLTQYFVYDELGRKVQTINTDSAVARTDYDLEGNVIATIEARGNASYQYDADGRPILPELDNLTLSRFDAFGHRVAMKDANNKTMTWTMDYFGQVSAHQDLDGGTVSYRYNASGKIVQETAVRYHLNFGSWETGVINYRYTDGLLSTIERLNSTAATYTGSDGLTTRYTYDRAGNRIGERQSFNDGAVKQAQNNILSYDMQNRLTGIRDDRYTLVYTYDANGNRSSVSSTVGGKTTVTYNTFDSMNRQLIVNGDSTDGGKTVAMGANGHKLSYDYAGNRLSDTYNGKAITGGAGGYSTVNGVTTETYRYDAMGRLASTTRDGVLIDERHYDAGGRVVESGMLNVNGWRGDGSLEQVAKDIGIEGGFSRYRYDANGRLVRQTARSTGNADVSDVYFTLDKLSGTGGYDAVGNLLGYTVKQPGRNYGDWGRYQMTYRGFDSYKESTNGVFSGKVTTSDYDVMGNRIGLTDGVSTIAQFWYDANGKIQFKSAYKTVDGKAIDKDKQDNFLLIANDQVFGYEDGVASNVLGSAYMPANAPALTSAPSAYTVQNANETLESIAQAIWGDSKLWYLIADANGLSAGEKLTVNRVLNIPTRVNTVHGDYATVKPFSASDAIGNTAPAIPPPTSSGHGGGRCGGLGKALMAVVAIAVTIYTGGLLASFAAQGFGSALLAGAVAGAAGSVASQVVGMAIGEQDGFNWKGVGMAALSGAVTAGVGQWAKAAGDASWLNSKAWTDVAARAAMSNTITQGIGSLTGLQHGFNWAGVAASYAGAAVGNEVGGYLKDKEVFSSFMSNTSANIANATVSGFSAGLTTAVMRGGKIAVAQIATDAFGNALGSSLAEQVNDSRTVARINADQMRSGQKEAAFEKDAWSARSAQDVLTAGNIMTADEVKRHVMLDILGEQARDDSLITPEMLPTGGPVRGVARYRPGSFEMVRNNNWDNALNLAADPFGFLGEVPGIVDELGRMSQTQAKGKVDAMREAMTKLGVKNVPTDYEYYTNNSGTGIDFKGTAERLGNVYEGYVRDQRLRETWGDDYESIRVGKSQMRVLEFEKKVLDVHLQATDRAYAKGVDLIASGELAVKDGQYARTLGSFVDDQVRLRLRDMAKAEDINDSSMSNIWAINRRIKNDVVDGYGIPDGRIGFNIFHDTTLARKDGYTPQLSKWNTIRPGNFLIIRPTELGGPYVVPRQSIQPYVPMPKLPGRKF